jgi:DtxR family Mn-dependent transcriptional regulator
MIIFVTEITSQRVRFWAEGDEHVLAPLLAVNISVVPLHPAEKMQLASFESLSNLKLGDIAKVINISPLCRGAERRRLMDLGILPGTIIKAEMVSPSGDPTAYRIRGALIGLRQEQAALIYITREVGLNTAVDALPDSGEVSPVGATDFTGVAPASQVHKLEVI